jgi:transposase InsO family protein
MRLTNGVSLRFLTPIKPGGRCRSQFTSPRFLAPLKAAEIQISMDGKGRAIDNIFIERLWRTVKYEHVYRAGGPVTCLP